MRRVMLAGAIVGVVVAALVPVALGGSGPSLAFAPTGLTFGPVASGTTTAAQSLTLRNSGGSATGALKVTLSGTGAARFTKTADTCTAVSLGPNKTCSVSYTYTPNANGASDTATVTISSKKPTASASATLSGTSTTPVNRAPVASNTAVVTRYEQTYSGSLAPLVNDPDGDPLSYALDTAPSHGTVVLLTSTGAFSYTPASGYYGNDSFTWKANDGSLDSNVATVVVRVEPPA